MQRKPKHKVPKVSGYTPRASANANTPDLETPSLSSTQPRAIQSTSVKVLPGGTLKIEPTPGFITTPLPATSDATLEPLKTADELPWSSWTLLERDDFADQINNGENLLEGTESSGVSDVRLTWNGLQC